MIAMTLLSTPEVEIPNDEKSVTSIIKEEETEMFPEGSISVQDIKEVVEIFPEQKDSGVLKSSEVDQIGKTLEQ